ncbi:MAG: hypothetical protein ACPGVD_00090 [Flavobacteriales bacterium]
MSFSKKYWVLTLVLIVSANAWSQKVTKNIVLDSSFYQLDSLSIVPNSFKIFIGKTAVSDSLFTLNYSSSTLEWKGELPVNLQVEYLLFSIDFSKVYSNKDTALIQPEINYSNPFKSSGNQKQELDLFGLDNLNKSGSISRGISVGNAQNLGVNSNFNLQLSGKIGGNIEVLASVTDDNVPIQPDGNTQQLQDFDNVFIQLSENRWKLIAGDYVKESMESHYLRYRKKNQGLFYSNQFELGDSSTIGAEAGAAVSRGKYRIQFFQGIESNQGPYKLTGVDNELFVLILSGTEQVFVDGILLKRGAENDYIIDYNTAEITFTPKFLITKNKRIEVQFQYSDRNYLRTMLHSEVKFKTKKSTSFIRFFSEQDHKNQPLFQDLTDPEIALMNSIGNDISRAIIERENTVDEEENVVSYLKKDSLGYTIYQFSTSADTTLYRLQFSDLGQGNGNYIQEGFSPFGKVYKWIKPDTVGGQIIKNGNYEPVVLIITPKRKQLLTLENLFQATENLTIKTDVGLSNNDLNTFSSQGNSNNYGIGTKLELIHNKKIHSNHLTTGGSVDFTSVNFNPIEKFRAIEFNRNWNLPYQDITTPLLLGNLSLGLKNDSLGEFNYQLDVLDLGETFRGFKNNLGVKIDKKKVKANYSGSLLNSISEINTNFYRHKTLIEYDLGLISIGYQDELENNLFVKNDSLLNSSYSFYDGRLFLKNTKNDSRFFSLYYGYRNEKKSIANSLTQSAYSNEAGLDYGINSKNKRTRLKGNIAYRNLVPTDSVSSSTPENTFLNQTNFSTSFWKQLVSLNTFYSVGSGLEQKREFVYVEVNPGQGVFTWIDYNKNGSKEINEFEIAAFQDQANYIRVFTQSNEYVRTYSNQFSQSVSINPRTLLKDKKERFWKFVSKISSVSAYRIDRKTTQESVETSLNPFANNLKDSSLVSLNKQILSSLFFNRTGYKYGVELKFQNNSNKLLLSNGFNTRDRTSFGVNLRYQFKKILVKWENEQGQKSLESDFLTSRNFNINYIKTSPVITFQKDNNFNWDFKYSYQEKRNQTEGEFASISTLGTAIKYTIVNKLNLGAEFNFVAIGFVGADNSSLEYEMLEGLKRGNNLTWELILNKRIAKNLDLSLNYTGRKPENIKTIHAGTVEIRAFF